MKCSSNTSMSLPKLFILHFALVGVVNAQENIMPPGMFCAAWDDNSATVCPSGDNALTSTDVKLTYTYTDSDGTTNTVGLTVNKTSEMMSREYSLSYPVRTSRIVNRVVYTVEQLEHGGGSCNCVMISLKCDDTDSELLLCFGSASIPRRARTTWTSATSSSVMWAGISQEMKSSPIESTCTLGPYIDIEFKLIINCLDPLDRFDEGVEFSVRLLSMADEWIPLHYWFENGGKASRIYIGPKNESFSIRGYPVNYTKLLPANETLVKLRVCVNNLTESFQFRWLETASSHDRMADIWAIDDIKVSLILAENNYTWIDDNFDEGNISFNTWPNSHIRNGNLQSHCNGLSENYRLVFGTVSPISQGIDSRGLLSNMFSPETVTITPATIAYPPKVTPTDQEAYSDEEFLAIAEDEIKNMVNEDQDLSNIVSNEVSMETLALLQTVTNETETHPLLSAYLFSDVVSRLPRSNFSRSFFETLVTIGSEILKHQFQNLSQTSLATGTTILTSFDRMMYNYATGNTAISFNNIDLRSVVVSLNEKQDLVTAIDSARQNSKSTKLTIPFELMQMFGDENGSVRIVAAIYSNISLFFSEKTYLNSDIQAASLQCGNTSCPSTSVTSSTNVTVAFEHSADMKRELETGKVETVCVFLDLLVNESYTLDIGHWSERGCTRNTSLSSTSRTVCDCNHLTHFAILLSPRPPVFDKTTILNLQIIGYVGVGVSIVAMAITALTFILFKSLHSMRGYIHINLCLSLSIAQIVFVAGVDQTGPVEAADVPLHCKMVAILIHYFFLVSFMWMLMEGVVLYVVLVKVFVKRPGYYIACFTALSYGLPALYLGFFTIPLQFTKFSMYGYDVACLLNPHTNFIWAFIVPFLLIFLVNIGFFIMAARVMWHYLMKKKKNSKLENLCNWFQASLSLVVVMGLTWILGVLIVKIEDLVPLAYIYTFMVAFQGCFIFLLFVVFSKVVRRAYAQCFKCKVYGSKYSSGNQNVLDKSPDHEMKPSVHYSRYRNNGMKIQNEVKQLSNTSSAQSEAAL